MFSKIWSKSKIVWAGVLITFLGIIPLIATFVKVIEPQWAIIINSALVMVIGILTVVFRIWFTDSIIY